MRKDDNFTLRNNYSPSKVVQYPQIQVAQTLSRVSTNKSILKKKDFSRSGVIKLCLKKFHLQ
jgi:hypothetical protein